MPHGVLFRGGEDETIRKNLVEFNHIDTIIGLPANIFFGTGIATIIMVLKQKRDNEDVLIIDASKGFVKDGKNNKLRACDIRKIADTVINRTEIPKFSRKISRDIIRENGYNLNIPRYVDSSDALETWDAYGTMFGGIPNHEIDMLSEYWCTFPSLRSNLFEPKEQTPCSYLIPDDINKCIHNNTDVEAWEAGIRDALKSLPGYLNEHLVQNALSLNLYKEEAVLAEVIYKRIESYPLIDKYNAYQILDDQWTVIHADLEMMQTEGFQATKQVDPNMVVKKAKKEEDDDIEVQKGWKGHILPFDLVQQILLKEDYYTIQQQKKELETNVSLFDSLVQSIPNEENENYFDEDNTDIDLDKVAEGLCRIISELKGIKGTITIKNVFQQVVKQKIWNFFEEDSTDWILAQVADKFETIRNLKKDISIREKALHELTKTTIENLSDDQVCMLLYEKWITPLHNSLLSMPSLIVDELAKKVILLAAKYETGLVEVEDKIVDASKALSKMLDGLAGSEFDIQAYKQFDKLLKQMSCGEQESK